MHHGHPGAHGMLDAQHQLPMPPQQQQMEEGHVPPFHGHQVCSMGPSCSCGGDGMILQNRAANRCGVLQGMHGDGPGMSDPGHLGQHMGGGPHRGRGRGWGRGGGSLPPFRRGQAVLDPAVLERRRKSTAAIIARQLAHVHVSESLAGQKVPRQ